MLLLLHCHYTTITLPLHYHCITMTLPLHEHYITITITLPIHYHYIAVTLPLHYHYITIALLLHYHYITITLPLHYIHKPINKHSHMLTYTDTLCVCCANPKNKWWSWSMSKGTLCPTGMVVGSSWNTNTKHRPDCDPCECRIMWWYMLI